MELSNDWRSFQSTFYPQRRLSALQSGESVAPMYFVVEGKLIIAAFAEHEDLSEWIGRPSEEAMSRYQHRDVFTFERSDVEKWWSESKTLPHFYHQLELIRERAIGTLKSQEKAQAECIKHMARKNFLLESIQNSWSKTLPGAFGVLLRLTYEGGYRDFILVVKRGQFEAFHEPDWSHLGRDRAAVLPDAVKYLSEKYLVPMQAVTAPEGEWMKWCTDANPWPAFARAFRHKDVKLFPFRMSLASVILAKGYLGA